MKLMKLSKRALKIFELGLPIVAIALIYCAAWIASLDTYDAARLYMQTYSMIEHVMMSLLLIVGGALLFDLGERERQS